MITFCPQGSLNRPKEYGEKMEKQGSELQNILVPGSIINMEDK